MKNKAYIRKSDIYIYLVKNKRLICCAFLWGLPVAASFVLGWRLVNEGTVFGAGGSMTARAGAFLLFLLETIALSVPAAALAVPVLSGLGMGKTLVQDKRTEGMTRRRRRKEKNLTLRPLWQVWLFYSLLIFLCWLPIFLAYYPSVFAYDAEGQLYQVIAGDYSTHHPLLHTIFLGAFFRLGGALGSYSAGMAVHSGVQMALMAGTFGWALCFLYKRRTAGCARILIFLFYAFFPANSVLALSTTKDVLFAALVLLDTLCLYQMVCGRSMAVGRKERAVYVIVTVLMLLFRNNAVYAFFVSAPILFIGLGRAGREKSEGKRQDGRVGRKAYLCMTLLILTLFGVSSFALKAVTHAKSGSPREMLSVPLQQMARTRVEAEEEIDPVMRQNLEDYLSSEWVFAAYNPHLADPVKNRAVIHDNPKGLIETWIRLGLEYPAIYVDAFLDNSLGLWYLLDTSHARVYGIGTESGFGYLSTDNRKMPAGCEIEEHSLLPGLRAFMEKIVSDNIYEKVPVIRILFAPALYWWLLYFYFVAALYGKRYGEMLPAVFPAVYGLTLLLSPTVLVRYMYPIMVTIPVILPCFMSDTTTKESENRQ